jgi:ribonuclease D
MLALPTKDPVWIATPLKLQEMVEELSHEPVVAVDTESNSLYAYRERVCLVQISTPQTDYLVDPLAIDDLSPLALLFADPMRQKIFHAAEYDVICLKRDYSFEFSNIFDTMIAARILAEPQVGLGSLL